MERVLHNATEGKKAASFCLRLSFLLFSFFASWSQSFLLRVLRGNRLEFVIFPPL
jgi:hypothetical protein